jgi:hypothetical protein
MYNFVMVFVRLFAFYLFVFCLFVCFRHFFACTTALQKEMPKTKLQNQNNTKIIKNIKQNQNNKTSIKKENKNIIFFVNKHCFDNSKKVRFFE